MLTLQTAMAVAALVAALLLTLSPPTRLEGGVALVVAALELLMALRLVRLGISGLPVGAVLGLALLVTGVLGLLKSSSKSTIASATTLTLVGAIQAAIGFGLRW